MASESRSIVGRVAGLALEERLAGLLPLGASATPPFDSPASVTPSPPGTPSSIEGRIHLRGFYRSGHR